MAHGYAKATGRIGVCILHDLVGLMNGSMGVYNAFGDHAPVLILGGSGPLDPADRRWIDWLHCASTQADIVKNYVKWTEEPTTPQWHLDAIAKAHKVALTAPRGPVYVTLDCGIQEQKINGKLDIPDPKFFQPAPPTAANPEALEAAADMLLNSELPVIVGGRFGINPAVTKPLVELIELTGAVYRDDLGMMCVPTAHPQNASGDREIVKEADLVMAIDCRDLASLLDSYTEHKQNVGSGRLRPGRKVIDMSLNDMSPSSWSYLRGPAPLVDVQINCDPILGMQQLNAVIRQRLEQDEDARARAEERRKLAEQRHKSIRARQSDDRPQGLGRPTDPAGPHGDGAVECGEGQELAACDAQPGKLSGRNLAVSRRRLLSRAERRRRGRLWTGRHGGRRDRLPRPGQVLRRIDGRRRFRDVVGRNLERRAPARADAACDQQQHHLGQ